MQTGTFFLPEANSNKPPSLNFVSDLLDYARKLSSTTTDRLNNYGLVARPPGPFSRVPQTVSALAGIRSKP